MGVRGLTSYIAQRAEIYLKPYELHSTALVIDGDDLSALARKLNCPVLSYDSDFYIHNVKYIPLITLTVKVNY